MKLEVIRIIENADLELAWAIRREVFVVEQNCPEDIEWEFEEESTHYLVKINGKNVGTARWRTTENGVKLERFAVLAEARNKGAASALLQTILADVSEMTQTKYLHAQLQAAPLYAKFGFKPKGENFWEADIEHVKMVWQA
jgi:predicted GNAT family N-acyltransferase